MTADTELSLRQFIDAWRVMCAPNPGAVDASDGGIDYVFSGLPIAFFNAAVPTGRDLTSAALRSLGEQACAWASPRNVPWLFVLTHDMLAPGTDAVTVLDACGLGPMMPATGMIARRIVPPARTPEDLHLAALGDDAACSALVDVNALAYGADLEASKPLLGRSAFWQHHFGVLGTASGKPASSAAVFMIDGYRYVALVATDPAQQRRGYGEAAMRHALTLAAQAHGDQPSVLHATEAGRPIYERMGYVPVSKHTFFMEKKYLGGH